MGFTGEHFRGVARILKNSRLSKEQKQNLANSFSRMFAGNNPDYRRDVFMYACGLSDKEPPYRKPKKASRLSRIAMRIAGKKGGKFPIDYDPSDISFLRPAGETIGVRSGDKLGKHWAEYEKHWNKVVAKTDAYRKKGPNYVWAATVQYFKNSIAKAGLPPPFKGKGKKKKVKREKFTDTIKAPKWVARKRSWKDLWEKAKRKAKRGIDGPTAGDVLDMMLDMAEDKGIELPVATSSGRSRAKPVTRKPAVRSVKKKPTRKTSPKRALRAPNRTTVRKKKTVKKTRRQPSGSGLRALLNSM